MCWDLRATDFHSPKTRDPADLALALKTVETEVRDRILARAPDRKATEAEISALGRRRLADVDAAQSRIVALIRRMEEDGEIVVGRPTETVDMGDRDPMEEP